MTPPLHKADLELVLLRARVPYTTSASAQLVALGKEGVVTSVTVTAGVDAAHYRIRDGDVTGDILVEVKAALGETASVPFPVGVAFENGVFAELVAGTTPDVYLVATD